MLDLDFSPDERKLRQFGFSSFFISLICLLFFSIKFAFYNHEVSWSLICLLLVLTISSIILTIIRPKSFLPLYITISIVAYPISYVVTNVTLFIFFYFLISPLALIFKLVGRDELEIRKKTLSSYWRKYNMPKNIGSYYKQF